MAERSDVASLLAALCDAATIAEEMSTLLTLRSLLIHAVDAEAAKEDEDGDGAVVTVRRLDTDDVDGLTALVDGSSSVDSGEGGGGAKPGSEGERTAAEGSDASSEATAPPPREQLLSLSSKETALLVAYLLHRRYGWSEGSEDGSGVAVEVAPTEAPGPLGRRFGRLDALSLAPAQKKALIRELANLLNLVLAQPLCTHLLSAFLACVRETNKPVVRRQAFIHCFQWMRSGLRALPRGADAFFPLVRPFVLKGLTDVWSAIRKVAATRLYSVLAHFSLASVAVLTEQLVAICLDREGHPWQAQDGAILGFIAIMKRFRRVSSATTADGAAAAAAAAAFSAAPSAAAGGSGGGGIRRIASLTAADFAERGSWEGDGPALFFGSRRVEQLPAFISSSALRVIYTLLAHPQLSIRETTKKAVAVYLSRCRFQQTVEVFNDTIGHLRGDSDDSEQEREEAGDGSALVLVGPSFAEGLLNVVELLMQLLPEDFLLSGWDSYAPVLEAYLAHPASTVRQATSAAFFQLVNHSRNSDSSPELLALVLRELSHKWEPAAAGKDSSWQWKEGRLLAYELILSFLVTNHVAYLYPAAVMTPSKRRSLNPDRTRPLLSLPAAKSSSSSTTLSAAVATGVAAAAAAAAAAAPPSSPPRTPAKQMLAAAATPSTPPPLLPPDSPASTPAPAMVLLPSPMPTPTASPLHKSLLSCVRAAMRAGGHDLSATLQAMIGQVRSCFVDSQFELRRMSAQVLPPLTELLAWYDVSILAELWLKLPHFVAARDRLSIRIVYETLKVVLRQVRGVELLATDCYSAEAMQLIAEVKQQLPAVLASVFEFATGNTGERITLLSLEVLGMAQAYFGSGDLLAAEVVEAHMRLFVERLQQAQMFAYSPKRDLPERASGIFFSPTAVASPSSSKPVPLARLRKAALIVDKTLRSSMYAITPELLANMSRQQALLLSPLLLCWVVQTKEPLERAVLIGAVHDALQRAAVRGVPAWGAGSAGSASSSTTTTSSVATSPSASSSDAAGGGVVEEEEEGEEEREEEGKAEEGGSAGKAPALSITVPPAATATAASAATAPPLDDSELRRIGEVELEADVRKTWEASVVELLKLVQDRSLEKSVLVQLLRLMRILVHLFPTCHFMDGCLRSIAERMRPAFHSSAPTPEDHSWLARHDNVITSLPSPAARLDVSDAEVDGSESEDDWDDWDEEEDLGIDQDSLIAEFARFIEAHTHGSQLESSLGRLSDDDRAVLDWVRAQWAAKARLRSPLLVE